MKEKEKLDNRHYVVNVYNPWIYREDYNYYDFPEISDFAVGFRFGRIFAKVFRDVGINSFQVTKKPHQNSLSKEIEKAYINLGEIFAKEELQSDLPISRLYTFGFLHPEYVWNTGRPCTLLTVTGFKIILFDDKFVVKDWTSDEDGKLIESLMQPKYQKRYRHAMYKRFGFKYLWHLHNLKKQEKEKQINENENVKNEQPKEESLNM